MADETRTASPYFPGAPVTQHQLDGAAGYRAGLAIDDVPAGLERAAHFQWRNGWREAKQRDLEAKAQRADVSVGTTEKDNRERGLSALVNDHTSEDP